jgi:hypothetical protein
MGHGDQYGGAGRGASAALRTEFLEAGLENYQAEALEFFVACKQFAGARVLEVGGHDLPPKVKFGLLGAAKWHCIDIAHHAAGDYQTYRPLEHGEGGAVALADATSEHMSLKSVFFSGDIVELPKVFHGRYDICVSICAFEHVQLLPIAINKIYAALDFNGSLLSYFGPIWSAFCGNHYWYNDRFNFNQPGPLEPHDHLLLSQPELIQKLIDADVDFRTACVITDLVHCAKSVNRLFFDDYERIMKSSRFSGFSVQPYGSRPVAPERLAALTTRHPRCSRFDAYGIQLNAWKLREMG